MGRKQKAQAPHSVQNVAAAGYLLFATAMMRHEAVTGLSDRAFRVLLVIQSRFNGYNNGRIQVSARWIAEQIGTQNYASIADAIDELVQRGLLVITFSPKVGQRDARMYRLTYASYGQANNVLPATNEWQEWEAGQKTRKRPKRGNRKQSGLEASSTQSVEASSTDRKHSVEASSTQGDGNNGVSTPPPVEASSTNIIYHGRADKSSPCSDSQNSGNSTGGVFANLADDPYMDADQLRHWVNDRIAGIAGAQSRLAKEANVPGGTFSKFMNGRGLPRHHRIAVQEALPRVIGPVRLETAEGTAGPRSPRPYHNGANQS